MNKPPLIVRLGTVDLHDENLHRMINYERVISHLHDQNEPEMRAFNISVRYEMNKENTALDVCLPGMTGTEQDFVCSLLEKNVIEIPDTRKRNGDTGKNVPEGAGRPNNRQLPDYWGHIRRNLPPPHNRLGGRECIALCMLGGVFGTVLATCAIGAITSTVILAYADGAKNAGGKAWAAIFYGTIKDERDRPLQGAKISFAGMSEKTRESVTSGRDGGYESPPMPPDTYEVSASTDGYDTTAGHVEVPAGRFRWDMTLKKPGEHETLKIPR